MPVRSSRRRSDSSFRIGVNADGTGGSPGALGLNLVGVDGTLAPTALTRAERVRVGDGALVRAPGPKRLYTFTADGASYTFGADTKYAPFTPPLIPKGGFAFFATFNATRPAAGKTGYIVGARPNGQTYHVFRVIISDAGAITVSWRDSGGATRTVTCAVVADLTLVRLLAVFDAVAGTFTVYVNGSSSGTPLTGLASTLQPAQDTGVVWTFGVEKETSVAVTVDSFFAGALDAVHMRSLAGTNPTGGSPTLLSVLLQHILMQWPNPEEPATLFQFDFDEPSGTTMYDQSTFANNGTYVGTPSVTAALSYSFKSGNYCGVFEAADGSRTNLVASGGQLLYQRVAPAAGT